MEQYTVDFYIVIFRGRGHEPDNAFLVKESGKVGWLTILEKGLEILF